MADIKKIICETVAEFVASKGASLSAEEVSEFLETPADSKLGDLALPCFRLSKLLRSNPAAISAEIAEKFSGIDGIEKITPVGPYLNFFFAGDKYISDLSGLLSDEYPNLKKLGEGKTMVLDFSSPNIAKRFHLGHLGTTVIGNAVRNIYNFCGYKTVALNYLGDCGSQNGKQIVAFKKWSSKDQLEKEGIKELERIYVMFG